MRNCPKCGFEKPENSESCVKCGVIFSKIRDTTLKDITYCPHESVPSNPLKLRINSRTSYMLIGCIVTMVILFQVHNYRTEKPSVSKRKTTISADGYSRIITYIDESGHKVEEIEEIRKPLNEEERQAIRRREERAEQAIRDRLSAKRAKMTPEEIEAERQAVRKGIEEDQNRRLQNEYRNR